MKIVSFALLLSGASSVAAVACSHYVSGLSASQALPSPEMALLIEAVQSDNGVTYHGTCTNQNTCHSQGKWWSVGDCGGGERFQSCQNAIVRS